MTNRTRDHFWVQPGGFVFWLALTVLATGCPGKKTAQGPLIRDGDRVRVTVVIPDGAAEGLQAAAADTAEALTAVTGAAQPAQVVQGDPAAVDSEVVVAVTVDPAMQAGFQCYRISSGSIPGPSGDRDGLSVRAASEQGAAYGLYGVLSDLGVLYFHPEESFFPFDPNARLPWNYDDTLDCPHFEFRGFHEHTQHPIVMSDFLLRTDDPAFRDYLSRYVRWLFRNRQNAMSFMLLKTVDLQTWIPTMSDLTEEAHRYGVQVGVSVSFVDQQQNAFKLIDEAAQGVTEAEQILQGLTELIQAGFDFFLFQIGSSEFTKPDDDVTVERLDIATAHLEANGLKGWAWIHTTCTLEDDQGGYFFHLPLRADPNLGAFVHTTMFYALKHPAPVYGCDHFGQQIAFMQHADGNRDMTFFPESAWWLGFDNNLPLIMPITGWSRAYDIQQALGPFNVKGHVTFTSGREWTYWQYDHFLARITWDRDFDWEAYLDWIAPVYAGNGRTAAGVLKDWTELQVRHFYETNPLIYFYLAGELPQDEIGAQAGILARRPKLSFRKLVRYDDEQFALWQTEDYALLESMRVDYRRLLDRMAPGLDSGTDQQRKLYRELHNALWVYVKRIEHALELYAGVAAVRQWDQEVRRAQQAIPPEEPDPAIRETALSEAQTRLDGARAVSAEVISVFAEMEADYRYPVELLCREKPQSPTSYPYGYIYETSTGTFWTRRDDQLDTLIVRTFQTVNETWTRIPDDLFYTEGEMIEVLTPDSSVASSAIGGFIPRLLYGFADFDEGAGTATLILAQDYTENFLPDPATEQTISLAHTVGTTWEGTDEMYTILVQDSAGADMGQLAVLDPLIRLDILTDGGAISSLGYGTLEGEVVSQNLIDMIVTIAGMDQEGAENLVKGVYRIPLGHDLPAFLPFAFGMTFERVP